jgi:hypothetical protein
MFNPKFNNADIHQHDWARRDRVTLLSSLYAGCAPQAPAAASSAGAPTPLCKTRVRFTHTLLARAISALPGGTCTARSTWLQCRALRSSSQ